MVARLLDSSNVVHGITIKCLTVKVMHMFEYAMLECMACALKQDSAHLPKPVRVS